MFRIFRHYIESRSLLALVIEFVAFALGFHWINILFIEELAAVGEIRGNLWFTSGVYALLVTAFMWGVGLYDTANLRSIRRAFSRIVFSYLLLLPLLVLLEAFALRTLETSWLLHVLPALAVIILVSLAIAVVFRGILASLTEFARVRRRILVLGAGERAARIRHYCEGEGQEKIEVAGFIPTGNETPAPEIGNLLAEVGTGRLIDLMRQRMVDEIVVAVNDRRGLPVQPLLECRMAGYPVTDYLSFWERESRKIMLESLDPSWLIYSDGFRVGTIVNDLLKRGLDLLIGILFVLLTLPLMLVIAVLIRIDSPGPVIFRQERVGREGRPFVLYKFRSMRQDAEAKSGPQWATEADPRITRIGHFIRKSRIDEIPQVFNVLKGDMSFIGPRPERPFFVEDLARQIPYFNERHRVAPGITGWAQINYPYGASVEDAREKLSYDLYYIKNYSIMLDLLVLLETIQVVFWPKGVR
ncbi:MAG: TIGR03013 family PEP-CTERM/XrtA system glycosyltransferase [Alphaproteobacteria bacterium]|nr:TIGR03013 family PEP-CTERM/XrtA system glycosyltransferase [Alphaproteobacteria bacterium]